MTWGSINESKLLNLGVCLNNAIRAIAFQNKFCHITGGIDKRPNLCGMTELTCGTKKMSN